MKSVAFKLGHVLAIAGLAGCPDNTVDTDDTGDTSGTTVADPTAGTTTLTPTTTTDGSSSGATSTTDAMTTGVGSSSTGAVDESSSDGGPPPVCGNNVLEGDEVCDLTQLSGQTCATLGYQGGTLGCLLNCSDYNLLGCFICGNGVVDMAEDCEGTVDKAVTCESLGYEAGTISCSANCLYDLSDCSICGDGIKAGPEQCDGVDYGGETCASLGFDMGTIGCNIPTCAYNLSGCTGGQYFEDFEAGVMPPQFTLGGSQGWLVDNSMPIAGTFSAHSGPITHNQVSSMTLTANFAIAGEISFFHKESTEPCCDDLFFYVDGVQVAGWSGANPSAEHVQPVAAGMHTFEWRYDKDGSVNTGSDTVWVDDIFLVGGVPI